MTDDLISRVEALSELTGMPLTIRTERGGVRVVLLDWDACFAVSPSIDPLALMEWMDGFRVGAQITKTGYRSIELPPLDPLDACEGFRGPALSSPPPSE